MFGARLMGAGSFLCGGRETRRKIIGCVTVRSSNKDIFIFGDVVVILGVFW